MRASVRKRAADVRVVDEVRAQHLHRQGAVEDRSRTRAHAAEAAGGDRCRGPRSGSGSEARPSELRASGGRGLAAAGAPPIAVRRGRPAAVLAALRRGAAALGGVSPA